MAHQTLKGSYDDLVDRLNRFPQGAPPSELLFKILKILLSEREAALVAQLPIRPFTAKRAASLWRLPEGDARKILDALADRALLLDYPEDGETRYVLPPPMAGFFEFSLMRVRGDVDQRALSELFYQYLNVEEDFVRELFARGETQLGRVFVNETALVNPKAEARGPLQVLDYERASEVVRGAAAIGVGLCYCRHKMAHLDRACDAPLDICMTFGTAASSLTRHGAARRVEAAECLDLLAAARETGLVQFGENVREGVSFICNCCGCCCEALIAARRFGFMRPVHTTNFLPELDGSRLQRVREVRLGVPRGCPGTRLRPQRPATGRQGGQAGGGPVPGLRRLRPGLPGGGDPPPRQGGARPHPPQHLAQGRPHGHRAGMFRRTPRGRPGLLRAPGRRRHPGRPPQDAADQAGAGLAAGEIALPRSTPRQNLNPTTKPTPTAPSPIGAPASSSSTETDHSNQQEHGEPHE